MFDIRQCLRLLRGSKRIKAVASLCAGGSNSSKLCHVATECAEITPVGWEDRSTQAVSLPQIEREVSGYDRRHTAAQGTGRVGGRMAQSYSVGKSLSQEASVRGGRLSSVCSHTGVRMRAHPEGAQHKECGRTLQVDFDGVP